MVKQRSLMDAPPERGEDVTPFVAIAEYLGSHGFSAPAILAADEALGLLLLEDLGDDLFARVLERDPTLETPLYEAATDLLVELHKAAPPKTLPAYDPALMTELAALSFDWYLEGATGETDQSARQVFCAKLEPLFHTYCPEQNVLIQRDYHAENLLWLPKRGGVAKVGLLDFQDALKGHRAYDLVSLLQDARRDVGEGIETAMLRRYIDATGQDQDRFIAAYRLLGVQRNLRIIGVFARLCMRDGKVTYLDLLPRVWTHLQRDLQHDALTPLRETLTILPAPEPQIIQRIKAKCATYPTP
jgi:aminoglycoside/choline kinase family phosphotransferase